MEITNLYKVTAFITKDGSEIRELLAHRNAAIRNQSLAEARLPADGATQEHYHPQTEEIYYITHGTGRIRIEGAVRDVVIGDAIAILPGQRHKLWNTGAEPGFISELPLNLPLNRFLSQIPALPFIHVHFGRISEK